VDQPSKPLTLVCDEMLSLDWLAEHFNVNVVSVSGREINSAQLNGADALLLRSVTQVNKSLLQQSSVKFVGTATIGTDHVDLEYLNEQGIQFAYAPGCNANAVVDYVMACIFAQFDESRIKDLNVAVLGYGNVGARLAHCLEKFNIACRVYDPLVSVPSGLRASSINELFECDVISLHVPLTDQGSHPTHHLLSEGNINQLGNCRLLINTARGEVVSNSALKNYLSQHSSISAALDVWENEPGIDWDLAKISVFATGHIAGYSSAGKRRGIRTVLSAMLDYFPELAAKNQAEALMNERLNVSEVTHARIDDIQSLKEYRNQLATIISIEEQTDTFMKRLENANNADQVAKAFDHFRKSYPLRMEIDYQSLLNGAN
jgi:erythronate-4-phosphate dehydrogenase